VFYGSTIGYAFQLILILRSITGATNDGYSTGDAIRVIEEEVAKLPNNYTVAYSAFKLERGECRKPNHLLFILSILVCVFLY